MVRTSQARLTAGILAVFSMVAVAAFGVAVTQPAMDTAPAIVSTALFGAFLAAEGWLTLTVWDRWGHEHDLTETLQRQFTAAAATSGGWVYVIDPQGRFVHSSDASRDSLGYEPAELLGRDARTLLTPDDVAHIDSRVGDVPQAVNVVVARGRHRNGEDRWFECTIAPILGPDGGEILGFSGTARRVTDSGHPSILREIHRRDTTKILAGGHLAIAFQPILDLTHGGIVGVEALSRFPTRPGLTPDVVFAEATNAGLGLELELLAVRRALEEAKVLDPALYVTANVSPATLMNPSLIDAVLASGLGPQRIVLEITEHATISDYSLLDGPRQRLRELGIRLAVDDAGAGYASLRHIVTLAPDIIKIDRALVADIDTDRARRALVMAVVVYAMEIGTTTVTGEGVETDAELSALRSLGVDSAQGYLLGRPTSEPNDWFSWTSNSAPLAPR